MRIIKKTVAKDANTAVIVEAATAAAALARGLRRDFRSEARTLTAALLDKLKDKTTHLVKALLDALTAFSAHCYALNEARRPHLSLRPLSGTRRLVPVAAHGRCHSPSCCFVAAVRHRSALLPQLPRCQGGCSLR